MSYKDIKQFAADLKPVYKAPIEEVDFAALDEFETKWGEKYPLGVKSWRCQLDWTFNYIQISAGDSQADLHHKRHWEFQPSVA